MAQMEHAPGYRDLIRVFGRIGLLSFGGPAGQIALMHRDLVDTHQWIDEEDYLHALNFCHLLPGPEAQQLATYIGWKLRGWRGGLIAGLLFVLPGAFVMLGLSALYIFAAKADWFSGLFLGIKAAVLAIIAQALVRIASRALDTALKQAIAVAAFLALALISLPFPIIVLSAAFIGALVAAIRPDLLALSRVAPMDDRPRPAILQSVLTASGWGFLWALPMAAIWIISGTDTVFWRIGTFFSQLAVVTFGGAYAVLAYMAQQAVESFGWLSAGEMADGLGLAETTPGPLIMVTQFVGFVAAFREPGMLSSWVAAVLGAGLTTWVTFAPCFLWIFTFAPWIDRLRSAHRLRGALAAITASVVGVIASLALWFGVHLLFHRLAAGSDVATLPKGSVPLPGFENIWFDGRAAAIALLASILIFRAKWHVLPVLAVCALAGFVLGIA